LLPIIIKTSQLLSKIDVIIDNIFAMFKSNETKTVIFDHIEPIKNTPECSL